MAKRTVWYAPEFKRQMVDLPRSGRTAASLAKEFPPSARTMALWATQDARDGGKDDGGVTSAEREELTRLRRRRLKEEQETLSKSRGLVCNGERSHFRALLGFVKVNQATLLFGTMCQVLKISRGGFNAWLDRQMCERRRFDLVLTDKIEAIHPRCRGTYGSPNIHADLADDHGIRVGRKRVARLMREAGLKGATLRRYVITTQGFVVRGKQVSDCAAENSA